MGHFDTFAAIDFAEYSNAVSFKGHVSDHAFYWSAILTFCTILGVKDWVSSVDIPPVQVFLVKKRESFRSPD